MDKWADYIISGVRYDSDHSKIVQVEIRQDLGESIGDARIVKRADVVSLIKEGVTFITAYYQNEKWHNGADVEIINVEGEAYIRTDGNKRKNDNLENLPEI